MKQKEPCINNGWSPVMGPGGGGWFIRWFSTFWLYLKISIIKKIHVKFQNSFLTWASEQLTFSGLRSMGRNPEWKTGIVGWLTLILVWLSLSSLLILPPSLTMPHILVPFRLWFSFLRAQKQKKKKKKVWFSCFLHLLRLSGRWSDFHSQGSF